MNWINIIKDLIEAGMTQKEIGVAISVSQATVSDLYRGNSKTIHYEAGSKLLALHKKTMRKAA